MEIETIQPFSLVRYDAACRALAEAKTVDDVKDVRDAAEAMRAYARQAKNKQLELDAAEIRIRAERRVGELMQAQSETVGLNTGTAGKGRPALGGSEFDPPKTDDRATLAGAGIDKHLADRARKLAALPQEKFERLVDTWRERTTTEPVRVGVDVLAPTAHVSQNSGDNEWFTPAEFIEPARKLLGGIDLDPASSDEANKVVKAKRFFTREDDGLDQKWEGRIWMNPPYAQPLIEHFANKLAAEVAAGSVSAAVVLVNNATETAWFRTMADHAAAICFPTGRVRFWHPDKASATPLQGQALLYIGSKRATFHTLFSDLGLVWVKP